jgi:hypothetical protein
MLSIMPVFAMVPKAEAGDMDSTHSIAGFREVAKRAAQPQRTIVTGDPLAVRPSRLTGRVRARMLGAALDRQLAAGRAPESSPLLAERAQHIVAIRSRQELARNWENLLRVAQRAHGTYHPARPIRSDRIIVAETAVRELVRRMTLPLPVAARGVAMATALLTDASSPVYNPHSRVSLAAELEAAAAQLDPALPLMNSSSVERER